MENKNPDRSGINPRNISGIHNYCDRWCERCDFTLRCAAYDPEIELLARSDKQEDQQKVWIKIADNFRAISEMIVNEAKQRGINLDDFDNTEYEKREEEIDEIVVNHYLIIESRDYSFNVKKWFESQNTNLSDIIQVNESRLEAGIDELNSITNLLDLDDAIEIIRFYEVFIYVKLRRALHSHLSSIDEDYYEDDDFPKDSDGSAKIALIAIDRSIAAWLTIHNYYKNERDDEIIQFMIKLDKLRRYTEKEFKDARAFKRPGFDTGESPYYKGD